MQISLPGDAATKPDVGGSEANNTFVSFGPFAPIWFSHHSFHDGCKRMVSLDVILQTQRTSVSNHLYTWLVPAYALGMKTDST